MSKLCYFLVIFRMDLATKGSSFYLRLRNITLKETSSIEKGFYHLQNKVWLPFKISIIWKFANRHQKYFLRSVCGYGYIKVILKRTSWLQALNQNTLHPRVIHYCHVESRGYWENWSFKNSTLTVKCVSL